MKRNFRQLILGSTAVLALSATPALAAGTMFDDVKGVDFSVEGGYLLGSGSLPYAQFYDGTKDYAFKVGPGNAWSGKFTADVHFDSGWSWSASYQHSSSSDSASTASYNQTNTAFDYPVWNILGFQDDSNSSGATSYNSASVKTDVHTDVIDLQAGHDVGLGIDGEVRLIGGLRIADYEQGSDMDLFCSRPGSSGSGCSPAKIEVAQHRSSRFSGFGPQVGADYNLPVSGTPFGVFSSALASALIGKQTTNTFSAWQQGTPYPTTTSFSDKHVAYDIDAKLGVSYTMPDCPVVVALGYQLSYMSKVRDTANGAIADGSSASYGKHQDDLLYHGPFLKLTYTP